MFIYSFKLNYINTSIRGEEYGIMNQNLIKYADADIDINTIKKFISNPSNASENTLDAIARYVSLYIYPSQEKKIYNYVDFFKREISLIIEKNPQILSDYEYSNDTFDNFIKDEGKQSSINKMIEDRINNIRHLFFLDLDEILNKNIISENNDDILLNKIRFTFADRFANLQLKFVPESLDKNDYSLYYKKFFNKKIGDEKSGGARAIILYFYLLFDEYYHLSLQPIITDAQKLKDAWSVYDNYCERALAYPAFVFGIELVLNEIKPGFNGKYEHFKNYIYTKFDELLNRKDSNFKYDRSFKILNLDFNLTIIKHRELDRYRSINLNDKHEIISDVEIFEEELIVYKIGDYFYDFIKIILAKFNKVPEYFEELTITDIDLKLILPDIYKFHNIKKLRLNSNNLESLSPEIKIFSELRKLVLSKNILTSLPSEIGELKKITSIDLIENHISSLPVEVSEWRNLKKIYLNSNQLTFLPPEVGGWQALREISLDNNLLTTLPPEISHWKNLEFLYLSNNNLTSLPEEIKHLSKLRNLNIYKNNLSDDEISKIKDLLPNCKIHHD